MCYYMDMYGVDMADFFPIETQNRLLLFLSNFDGEFWRRKVAFEAMLYELATTEESNNKCFATTLMNALFKRVYLKDYKWPTAM